MGKEDFNMISPYEAALALCKMSGWTLTNLRLQKMLYLLQADYIRYHGFPLIHDSFEARDIGPIMPTVYDKLKQFGNRAVKDVFLNVDDIDGTDEYEYIKSAFKNLASLNDIKLFMAVRSDGVWQKIYRNDIDVEITNEEIQRVYK